MSYAAGQTAPPVPVYRTVNEVYKHLRLPVPRDAQSMDIRLGRLLPLEEYGVVLRAEISDTDTCEEPLALQPLAQFEVRDNSAYGLSVRLYPGMPRVGISQKDHQRLGSAFECFGYALYGSPDDDCGYIPLHTGQKEEWLPVLFDVTDTARNFDWRLKQTCRQHGDITQVISDVFNRSSFALNKKLKAAQDYLYGDLRALGRRLMAATPDQTESAAHSFWAALRRAARPDPATGEVRLHAAWKKALENNNAGPRSDAEYLAHNVALCSRSYAYRLRENSLHSAVLEAA